MLPIYNITNICYCKKKLIDFCVTVYLWQKKIYLDLNSNRHWTPGAISLTNQTPPEEDQRHTTKTL